MQTSSYLQCLADQKETSSRDRNRRRLQTKEEFHEASFEKSKSVTEEPITETDKAMNESRDNVKIDVRGDDYLSVPPNTVFTVELPPQVNNTVADLKELEFEGDKEVTGTVMVSVAAS